MLREIQNVTHIHGQGVRRWFNDEHLDLFVWYDAGGRILGFQLCFDKQARIECALTYTEEAGYCFEQVAAEASVCDLGSPVLFGASEFSRRRLLGQLSERGAVLERPLYEYLREKLEACPAPPLPCETAGAAPETASDHNGRHHASGRRG
jgi:hypothetical protein